MNLPHAQRMHTDHMGIKDDCPRTNRRRVKIFPHYVTDSAKYFRYYAPAFAIPKIFKKIWRKLLTWKLRDAFGTLTSKTDQYEILDFIDEGSFGMVVKCGKVKSKKIVAMKISHESLWDVYQNECTILRRLSRENPDKFHVLRMLDSFTCGDSLFLVTEMLNKSLRDHFIETKCRPFLAREVSLIAEQLFSALAMLKRLRIMHGDIKPENILFLAKDRRRLQIKLIDFGLAMQLPNYDLPKIIQTVSYRAPEVILRVDYSEAVDMWSTGCVLAELLMGAMLYPGQHEYDVMRLICETQGLPSVHLLNPSKISEDYFILNVNRRTYKLWWKLKSAEQYMKETGHVFRDDREYVLHNLYEIADKVTSHIKDKKGYAKEIDRRFACVNLIKKMLALNDRKRISPKEALKHSFICNFDSL